MDVEKMKYEYPSSNELQKYAINQYRETHDTYYMWFLICRTVGTLKTPAPRYRFVVKKYQNFTKKSIERANEFLKGVKKEISQNRMNPSEFFVSDL